MGYTLIASQVLSASAASVTFSSIPQTYKSLKLIVSSRNDYAAVDAVMWLYAFNGSAVGGSYRYLSGNGSATGNGSGSNTQWAGVVQGANATANTFSNTEITIPNYTSTSNKAVSVDSVDENNAAAAGQLMSAILVTSTSAVTSLTMQQTGGTVFVAGTSMYLYGIS